MGYVMTGRSPRFDLVLRTGPNVAVLARDCEWPKLLEAVEHVTRGRGRRGLSVRPTRTRTRPVVKIVERPVGRGPRTPRS